MKKIHVIAIAISLLMLLTCFSIYYFAPAGETVEIRTVRKEEMQSADPVILKSEKKETSLKNNENATSYANFEHAIDLLIDYTN